MLIDDEMVDIKLDNAGYICPEQTDKIALIDADTVIYASCEVISQKEELLAREFYNDQEWYDIESSGGYNPEDNTLSYINLDMAYEHSMDKIKSIVARTGCSDYELHFTRGRKSFPYTMVDKDYKGNRDFKSLPYGLSQLKDYFVEKHPDKAFNNTKWEADHIVVCKRRDFPDKYILCAVDKDVLLALPGRHFNYYTSTKHNIAMKWVDITEDDAMRRYYIQVLTGDTGDNVIGLEQIGIVKATKALARCKDEVCLWKVVVKMYEEHNRGVVDAITNMRLVDMRQLELNKQGEYEVKLWKPKVTV